MNNNAHTDGKENAQAKSQAPSDERLLVSRLEQEPVQEQVILAEKKFQDLLRQASQPRHASGKACLQLCHFLEQCKKSQSQSIREVAFSENTSLGLFNFYVEWNEKNQNRSMRQVLELLSSLIAQNPDRGVSSCVKAVIFQQSLPLITHEAAHPLVKPSFKSLECLLGKSTISPEELLNAYEIYRSQNVAQHPNEQTPETDQSWDPFVSAVFYWLGPADVSAAVGKFLVTLFKTLRTDPGVGSGPPSNYSSLWQRWIRTGLSKNHLVLENVKNYLFSPLFKLDRPGSLEFLRDLNKQGSISDIHSREIDAHALVQLAAIDAGKKSGLVEEPNILRPKETHKKSSGSVVLDEEAIGSLLTNSSDTIRSLAFSVLTSSFSSTRPFSPAVLDMLRPNMGLLYSDTDAKFRNEVLSNTKHLIERLRGATALLARELEQSSFKLSHGDPLSSVPLTDLGMIHDATEDLLLKHQKFLEWYVDFLLAELSSTSSYQRHIMALRAINLLLHSHLRGPGTALSSIPVPANATIWPFTLRFFNSRSMRLLLDLLLDPFEDVRSSAADVLKLSDPANFTKVLSPNQKNASRRGSPPPLEAVQDIEVAEPAFDQSPTLLIEFISRAEEASKRTGRADYADGVARSYRILYGLQASLGERLQLIDGLVKRLEEKVVMAERDLALAVLEAPVHADFAALSLVSNIVDLSLDSNVSETGQSDEWEKWASLQFQMVSLASRIWNAVKEVLCNDSPEGNLPNGIDEVDTIDTKDVLSYSFRAVHESSNLTRILSLNLKESWPAHFASNVVETFTSIGNLAFQQLSTLRHRGAFSTVSLTFSNCCNLVQHKALRKYFLTASATTPKEPSSQPEPSSIDILDRWWKGSLIAIETQPATTRRSAGIPSLVTAIMASSTPMDFDERLNVLVSNARKEIADGESSSNVHALNSLRALFRETNTRQKLLTYVVAMLSLAEQCFISPIWEIRNCGLLLFQTLTDVLLGAETKEQMEGGWTGEGAKIAFSKFPGLLDLLLSMLEESCNQNAGDPEGTVKTVEKLFPALDIIRRAGAPAECHAMFFKHVSTHLGSKVWQVRDLAARTICSLMPNANWQHAAELLLHIRDGSTNLEHGVLLAVQYTLEREADAAIPDEHLNAYVQRLNSFFHCHFGERKTASTSPDVLAANLKVGNFILRMLISKIGRTTKGSSVYNSATTGFTVEPYSEMVNLCQLHWDPARADSHAALLRGICLSALKSDTEALKKIVKHALGSSQSTAVSVLNTVSAVWNTRGHQGELVELFRVYASTFEFTNGPAVCAAALANANGVLDEIRDLSLVLPEFCQIVKGMNMGQSTPKLANEKCKSLGNITHARILVEKASSEPIEGLEKPLLDFGVYLALHLEGPSSVPSRLAAVCALRSFFSRQGYEGFLGSPYLITILIILYGLLDDDDHDVRSLAAATVALLTKKSSTPLAAADEFLDWMTGMYKTSLDFAYNTVERITGRNFLVPPKFPIPDFDLEEELAQVMLPDNSLFAEEAQNLWRDEHRERVRWAKTLRTLYTSSNCIYNEDEVRDRSPLNRLTEFATKGFEFLANRLSSKKEDAQNWDSKPEIYSLCAGIVVCAHEVLVHLAYKSAKDDNWGIPDGTANLLVQLRRFMDEADASFLHPQLLYQLLGREVLSENRLGLLLPQQVQSMLTKYPYLKGPQARFCHSLSFDDQATQPATKTKK